jgi:hypothetical protein
MATARLNLDQPELPAELVRPEQTLGLAAVFMKDEQLAEADGRAVPVGALKNLHAVGIVTRRAARDGDWL